MQSEPGALAHDRRATPPERHYIQFDLSKSEEEMNEDIYNWLVEVLGPPEDETGPT